MEQSSELLECSNLSIGYNKPLSNDINFSLSSGQILLLQGDNGAGKSTLIKTILGNINSLGGTFGWNIDQSSISYLPQITNPLSHFSFTVKEIINLYNMPLRIQSRISPNLLSKKWIDISGGEKQKVMLLSRIDESTKVLILDEPFNHLDFKSVKSLVELLVELVESEEKLSIILVSHLNVNVPHELLNKVTLQSC